MSSSIVTIWSHTEAFCRDRFMFAKESSESFFFHCIPPKISPLRAVQGMSRFGNLLGWFTTHLLFPRSRLKGKGERWWWWPWLQEEGAPSVFLTTSLLSATSWSWKQRGGPGQRREG